MLTPVTLMAGAVLVYAVFSRRLSRTVVTAPIFFAGLGILAGPVLGLVDLPAGDNAPVLLLEAALVMVLFADASGLDVRRWTREPALSGRLLGIGLPLTMVGGTVIALLVLTDLEPWQAGLIGFILAPTDAALGQAVVSDPRVPAVVRDALNVESGLNDGLVLPFVTVLITVGLLASGAETELKAIQTLALALVGSTVIGLLAGFGGGLLIRSGAARALADLRWAPIALVALAAGTFGLADEAGASGFLAVWVAGLCAGTVIRGHLPDETLDLPERLADVLTAIGFLMLGAVLLAPALGRATGVTVVYAVLSLTLIRIVPVAVSMLRTGLAPATIAYLGWFGPRGLASVVFAGLVTESGLPDAPAVTDIVLLTVALSILAHGVTAAWGARRYAAWFERASGADPSIPEATHLAAPRHRRRAVRADAERLG